MGTRKGFQMLRWQSFGRVERLGGWWVLVLLLLTAAPGPAEEPTHSTPTAGGVVLRPVSTEKIKPWRSSIDAPFEVKKGVAMEWAPEHSFFPPEALARYKSSALVAPDLPEARELGGDSAAPGTGTPRPKDGRVPEPKGPVAAVNFNGLDIVSSQHNGLLFIPPDTMVAASRSKVLTATNVALRIYSRTGKAGATQSLNNFFGVNYPPILFDPKVFYDELSDRFVVVALSLRNSPRQSHLYLAVSRSGRPNSLSAPADWCTYRINAQREVSWADYPGLGMNERWLAVSTNHFGFNGSFNSSFLFVFDKQVLVNNARQCPQTPLYAYKPTRDPSGFPSFTIQPAQHYSPSNLAGTPLFLVSSQPAFDATDYTLWRLTDAGAGQAPNLTSVLLDGNFFYSVPPNSPQGGGPELDTGDMRVQQAAFRNGKIWAVHATGCSIGPAPNESCVRAIEITPTATGGSLTFQETYGEGDGWYLWMPGVAITAGGDVVVPFQRGRQGTFFGVGVNGKRSDNPHFDEIQNILSGTCNLFNEDGGGRNRSGDYVGAQADPGDQQSVWVAGEYAGNVPGQGCEWRTRIARVRY